MQRQNRQIQLFKIRLDDSNRQQSISTEPSRPRNIIGLDDDPFQIYDACGASVKAKIAAIEIDDKSEILNNIDKFLSKAGYSAEVTQKMTEVLQKEKSAEPVTGNSAASSSRDHQPPNKIIVDIDDDINVKDGRYRNSLSEGTSGR